MTAGMVHERAIQLAQPVFFDELDLNGALHFPASTSSGPGSRPG
jgi:hypothetical protein